MRSRAAARSAAARDARCGRNSATPAGSSRWPTRSPSWKSSTCCSTGSGRARGENVAGQQQHRQAVDVRERRGGDHVGRAGADRRRARHHAPAHVRLGVGDRRVRHRLLVVRAVGRQHVAVRVQRFADAGDVAVAEDREHAAEQRPDAAGRRPRCAARRDSARAPAPSSVERSHRACSRSQAHVAAAASPRTARLAPRMRTRRSAPRSSRAIARDQRRVVDRRRRATARRRS